MKIKLEPLIAVMSQFGGTFRLSDSQTTSDSIFIENNKNSFVFYNQRTRDLTTNSYELQMFLLSMRDCKTETYQQFVLKNPDFVEKFPVESWFQ